MITLVLDDFPSDRHIKLRLVDQKKLDAQSREGSDSIDTQRWGYFQPRNGQGSILEFRTGCNKYGVIDERIGGPIVIPGNNELHDHVKLDGAGGGASICTSVDGTWHCLSDKYAAQFGRLEYMYRDTLHAKALPEGVFMEYALVDSEGFRGTYGTVKRVVNPTTARHFALKVVHAIKRMRGMPERATFEICTLNALDHPNVCNLEDILLTSDNSLHIVKGLAANRTSYDLLGSLIEFSHSELPPQETAGSITFQFCAAMEFIHSKGLIHRDLKPDNILIASEVPLVLKVADFGLATKAMIEEKVSEAMLNSPQCRMAYSCAPLVS